MFEVITFSVFSSYLFPSLPTHSLQLAFASWAESALWLEIQTLGPEQRCYLLPLWGTSLLSVQFLWRQKVRSVYLPKFLLILKSLIYFALTYTYLKIVAVWTYCIWLQWFRVTDASNSRHMHDAFVWCPEGLLLEFKLVCDLSTPPSIAPDSAVILITCVPSCILKLCRISPAWIPKRVSCRVTNWR